MAEKEYQVVYAHSWKRLYDVGGSSFPWGSEEIIQRSGIICSGEDQCYFKTCSDPGVPGRAGLPKCIGQCTQKDAMPDGLDVSVYPAYVT